MAQPNRELPIILARKAAPSQYCFTPPHPTRTIHDHHLTPHGASSLTRGRALHCCTVRSNELLALNFSNRSVDEYANTKAITMAVLIDTGAMDIDSNIASPVRAASIRSDLSNVSFIDKVEGLPSNGPTKHAHLIDLGEYAEGVKDDGILQLQDAVATILYKASPDTLNSFLSPTVNTIKVVFGKKDVQLVIWRKGLEVFVSVCTFPRGWHWLMFSGRHV
jgi:hypothetical protein